MFYFSHSRTQTGILLDTKQRINFNRPSFELHSTVVTTPKLAGWEDGILGKCNIDQRTQAEVETTVFPSPLSFRPPNFVNVQLCICCIMMCYSALVLSTCGGEIPVTEDETTFVSIGYPQYHEESQRCEWQLKAKEGTNVLLEFYDLDFGDHCYKDGIWIYDGKYT